MAPNALVIPLPKWDFSRYKSRYALIWVLSAVHNDKMIHFFTFTDASHFACILKKGVFGIPLEGFLVLKPLFH